MGSRTTWRVVGVEDDKGAERGMPSFNSELPNSNSCYTEGNTIDSFRVSDFGAFDQSYHIEDAVDLSGNPVYNSLKVNSQTISPGSVHISSLGQLPISLEKSPLTNQTEPPHRLRLQKVQSSNPGTILVGNTDNWEESTMADASPRTDISTDGDTDDKNHPAYVQQLESSRLKLTQLEQELQRARQQGIFISSSGDQAHTLSGNGAMQFDAEYARWLEEQNRQINELRAAVNSHASDTELRMIVDGILAHYDEIFRLKGVAAKADVFHLLSGMWKTPAERCFLWLGGFRSSELLKLLVSQLEPLTEQQLMGITNLQQSSQQAEDALSQGMEALQQSLAETLSTGAPASSGSSGNVASYMGQMAMAMGKLGTLEGFIQQADNLRQQTLQQMHRILTTRQSARALLAIHDYISRLRALSSLWLARPRD
ncbi:hypothetical protein AAZV13_13G162200 [Glycine max]